MLGPAAPDARCSVSRQNRASSRRNRAPRYMNATRTESQKTVARTHGWRSSKSSCLSDGNLAFPRIRRQNRAPRDGNSRREIEPRKYSLRNTEFARLVQKSAARDALSRRKPRAFANSATESRGARRERDENRIAEKPISGTSRLHDQYKNRHRGTLGRARTFLASDHKKQSRALTASLRRARDTSCLELRPANAQLHCGPNELAAAPSYGPERPRSSRKVEQRVLSAPRADFACQTESSATGL